MAVLKIKQVREMKKDERKSKMKDLKFELTKAKIPGKSKIRVKEIKKAIARILTINKSQKIGAEEPKR